MGFTTNRKCKDMMSGDRLMTRRNGTVKLIMTRDLNGGFTNQVDRDKLSTLKQTTDF